MARERQVWFILFEGLIGENQSLLSTR